MRCALETIAILRKYYDFDYDGLFEALNKQLGVNGISIYTLINVSLQYELHLSAKKGLFLPTQCPCILFYRPLKRGHYNVLLRNERFYIVIKDTQYNEKKIFKPWFYLFFSHIYILCYNVKKEVENGS